MHLRLLAVPLLLTGCGHSSEESPRPVDVVLITLDTTRADVLAAGPERAALAPHLDRLFSEGVEYTEARSVSPLTLPAHASMMTGLYPPRTGVRGNGPMMLGAEAVTLAERARGAGYRTAAFVAALALDRVYGLEQGFEVYDQPRQRAGRAVGAISERPATEVVSAARAFLASHDDRGPLFLWVHFFDPHAPYEPPPGALDRAGGDLYRGEVAAMDQALGSLLEELGRAGLLERALVAVVGDHGEALGEHGEPTHGQLCYDGTLRVPFMLRYPDGHRAGQQSAELVSVVDVQATLLECMGLAPPDDADGVSLYRRSAPATRGLYFESFEGWRLHGWSPLVGWIDRNGKYIHSSRPELILAGTAEGEGGTVAADRADTAPYLQGIRSVLDGERLAPPGRTGLDEARRRELAALGYTASEHAAGDFPDPLEVAELQSPAERIGDTVLLEAASVQLGVGKLSQAAATLEELVERNPDSPTMLEVLARCRLGERNFEAALELLQRRLALPPESIATHRDLATCLRELGRPQEADAHVRRSLELLIEWSERRGELEQAARYRRILEQAPQPPKDS